MSQEGFCYFEKRSCLDKLTVYFMILSLDQVPMGIKFHYPTTLVHNKGLLPIATLITEKLFP